jgi:hypothetical protein
MDDPPGDPPLGIYSIQPEVGGPKLATTSLSGEGLPAADQPPQTGPPIDPAFRVPADAEGIFLSPDASSVAWTVGSSLPVNTDRRQRSLWVVSAPMEARRRLAVLIGGDLAGWAEDGRAVITTGRLAEDGQAGIWRVPIDGSSASLLSQANRPRGARLSPSGRWLAFYLAFEVDPSRNGLRVIRTSGGAERRVPAFGSYRWSEDERLCLIPFAPPGQPLTLISFDPGTGTSQIALDAGALNAGIAGNDWSISPNAEWFVFRSVQDGGLWVLPLKGG